VEGLGRRWSLGCAKAVVLGDRFVDRVAQRGDGEHRAYGHVDLVWISPIDPRDVRSVTALRFGPELPRRPGSRHPAGTGGRATRSSSFDVGPGLRVLTPLDGQPSARLRGRPRCGSSVGLEVGVALAGRYAERRAEPTVVRRRQRWVFPVMESMIPQPTRTSTRRVRCTSPAWRQGGPDSRSRMPSSPEQVDGSAELVRLPWRAVYARKARARCAVRRGRTWRREARAHVVPRGSMGS